MTIAAKFGGSSTADASALRRVGGIIKQNKGIRVIVLSAPGRSAEGDEKITSLLYRCWQFRDETSRREAIIHMIQDRFRGIAQGLGLSPIDRLVRDEIEESLSVSEAQTASRGEYLCARLFSEWSGMPMLDAADLVRFHATGALDEDATVQRVAEALNTVPAAVIPGFYGADETGRVHTLPRNGSDITGALVAAGIQADGYENWTDVPGLMTADPELVPDAQVIPRISYHQMRLLAAAGAQVLHPACLEPVEKRNIPTRIRDTWHPELPGTLVTNEREAPLRCVACRAAGEETLLTVFGLEERKIKRLKNLYGAEKAQSHEDFIFIRVPRGASVDVLRKIHNDYIVR